jgi:outer membrane murein-binding lipoprotein Lpp
MDTLSAIAVMLKELGTPTVMIIGFAWVIFNLNTVKKDMSVLKTELKADISVLSAEVRADISVLKTDVSELKADVSVLKSDVSELKADMKSIRGNHLPHIEAAMRELAKGTPNEAHVNAILDLSHKADTE